MGKRLKLETGREREQLILLPQLLSKPNFICIIAERKRVREGEGDAGDIYLLFDLIVFLVVKSKAAHHSEACSYLITQQRGCQITTFL